eukprot:14088102-Ditylum_brightwellii.AAC.1
MPGALAVGGTLLDTKDLVAVQLNSLDHPFFDDTPEIYTVPLPAKGRLPISQASSCFTQTECVDSKH